MKAVVYMHRIITMCPPNEEVDHIDSNKLNNSKLNLRLCTRSENCMNSSLQRGKTSRYKGVSRNAGGKRKWQVHIGSSGKKYSLGSYDDEVQAAIVYNAAAIKYHGKFAKLNPVGDFSPTVDACGEGHGGDVPPACATGDGE